MIQYIVHVDVESDGSERWYYNGRLHRENGPAVIRADGYKAWWLNGGFHREDGPAVEDSDGSKAWWLNGKRHREDGPAIESSDGYKAWWLNGLKLSEAEFIQRTQPPKELTLAEVNKLLGYKVKIIE